MLREEYYITMLSIYIYRKTVPGEIRGRVASCLFFISELGELLFQGPDLRFTSKHPFDHMFFIKVIEMFL